MRLLPPATVLLTLSLAACGSSGGSEGATLYRTYACAQCHGEKGQGSPAGLGPTLRGKHEFWDAAKLDAYLRDPKGYAAGVDRLGQAKTAMPALPSTVTAEERAVLVEHTLGLMD